MDESTLSEGAKKKLHELQTSSHGLSEEEVRVRSKKYGSNSFVEQEHSNPLLSLLSRFNNPLVLILLLASLLSAVTGDTIDFFIIVIIVILSVTVDFIQEYQSQKAAEKLRQKVLVRATVLRSGEKKEVLVSHITLGDILFLSIGDIVPADAQILSAKDLHIDESVLTGESFPQEKQALDTVFTGASVVNGEAWAVVTAIGKSTQFGKLSHVLNTQKPPTDFQKGIQQAGYLVLKMTIILVIGVFSTNILLHKDIVQSLVFSLALAVGLTPELLPLIVTVNLAQGALRMAKKGVIVKHLPSIQNLGSMQVLCTDKTGTITENKITLEKYESLTAQHDAKVLQYAYMNSFFQSSSKNPLDKAVLVHKHEVTIAGFEKIDEIPFDFIRKRLSVIVTNKKESLLIVKGAPEEMMEHINEYADGQSVKKISPVVKEKIAHRFQELSAEGFRVLAIAYKSVSPEKKVFAKTDEKNLIFLGLTVFFDPPKAEAKEIFSELHNLGISLKILTGDNEAVTRKVCEEINLPVGNIVLGHELENCSLEQLATILDKTTIFARVTPDQKQRIITVLRQAGNVVGFMGDGVNDASSLKSADVGISVNNAVDVAKSAADIILVTKSLKILQEGVLEGRQTFANVKKYLFVGFGSNFGNMISVSLASLFLPFLPLLPVQILLNNLLYDFSQLAIPFDKVDSVLVQKPGHWDANFLKKSMLIFGPVSSLFDVVTFLALLIIFHASIPFFRTGWFAESIISQSLIIFSLRTTLVPFFRSKPANWLVLSALTVPVMAILLVQLPWGAFFQFTALSGSFWVCLFFIVVIYFMLVEVVKTIAYKTILK